MIRKKKSYHHSIILPRKRLSKEKNIISGTCSSWSPRTILSYLILLFTSVVLAVPCHHHFWRMPPRSSKGSFSPPNDNATYKDLLLFEERLKINAASLQRRKSRYQRALLYFNWFFLLLTISLDSLSIAVTAGHSISSVRSTVTTFKLTASYSL